jgi:hypothetical protein
LRNETRSSGPSQGRNLRTAAGMASRILVVPIDLVDFLAVRPCLH